MKVKGRWSVSESAGTAPRIDEKAGVIYNVLILGRKARNRRHYTDEAKEAAVTYGTYENLQVYIGPHKKKRIAKRSPNDHAGELRNTRLAPDGIRGDLHYNRASRGGKLALEIAKRFPKHFGLSHHADVAGYIGEDGEKYITRILEATVADIVKDPSTTDNVFEDVEAQNAKKAGKQVRQDAKEEGEVESDGVDQVDDDADADGGGWADSIKQLIGEIHDDDSIDDDVKMKATKMAMKLKKLLNGDDADDDADEGGKNDADEAVDVAKLVRREVKRAVGRAVQKPQPQPQARKSSIKPRSSARSEEAAEDVEQKPKPKQPAKPLPLKKREDIIAAYEDDE